MKSKRNRLLHSDSDSDPMGTVANLFDVAMVFAVALMVALVSRFNMTEMFSKEDFTMVKNPGKENMEIITKEGNKINKYTPLPISVKEERKWELPISLKMERLSMCRNKGIQYLLIAIWPSQYNNY